MPWMYYINWIADPKMAPKLTARLSTLTGAWNMRSTVSPAGPARELNRFSRFEESFTNTKPPWIKIHNRKSYN